MLNELNAIKSSNRMTDDKLKQVEEQKKRNFNEMLYLEDECKNIKEIAGVKIRREPRAEMAKP